MGFLSGTAGKILDPGGYLVEKTQDAVGLQQFDPFAGLHGTAAAYKKADDASKTPAATPFALTPTPPVDVNQNKQAQGPFGVASTSLY